MADGLGCEDSRPDEQKERFGKVWQARATLEGLADLD
jgi:hypothetical protein